jgi:hypothetical protein
LTADLDRHTIVEIFNNGAVMATVNFSVPEDVKDAFNATFEGRNKSAIVAELLREAVEREKRRKAHVDALDRILDLRKNAPRITQDEIRRLRAEMRR